MHNINLICTRHEEKGVCNVNELYKIIEAINPKVIFEEIPPSFFDKYYMEKISRNLESDTVNKYLETHNIQHIPVDSDNVPSDSFFKDLQFLYKRIEGLADINGFNYRSFSDKNNRYTGMYGFQYLNSHDCINLNDEIYDAIEKGLEKINDDKLFQIYKLWKDINNKREDEIINNIYEYSKTNQYNQALLLIGSGHRKSIIQKIQEYEKESEINLNWKFSII